MQDTEVDYYGDITWLLLININLPLLLFFRYHSSICLADVWHIAYYPVEAKLHESNRSGQPTSKMASPARVQETSRDRCPMIMVTGISRTSSVTNLDIPEANGSTTGRRRAGLKMLEGIDIVAEDGVLYRETLEDDEAYGSSL